MINSSQKFNVDINGDISINILDTTMKIDKKPQKFSDILKDLKSMLFSKKSKNDKMSLQKLRTGSNQMENSGQAN